MKNNLVTGCFQSAVENFGSFSSFKVCGFFQFTLAILVPFIFLAYWNIGTAIRMKRHRQGLRALQHQTSELRTLRQATAEQRFDDVVNVNGDVNRNVKNDDAKNGASDQGDVTVTKSTVQFHRNSSRKNVAENAAKGIDKDELNDALNDVFRDALIAVVPEKEANDTKEKNHPNSENQKYQKDPPRRKYLKDVQRRREKILKSDETSDTQLCDDDDDAKDVEEDEGEIVDNGESNCSVYVPETEGPQQEVRVQVNDGEKFGSKSSLVDSNQIHLQIFIESGRQSCGGEMTAADDEVNCLLLLHQTEDEISSKKSSGSDHQKFVDIQSDRKNFFEMESLNSFYRNDQYILIRKYSEKNNFSIEYKKDKIIRSKSYIFSTKVGQKDEKSEKFEQNWTKLDGKICQSQKPKIASSSNNGNAIWRKSDDKFDLIEKGAGEGRDDVTKRTSSKVDDNSAIIDDAEMAKANKSDRPVVVDRHDAIEIAPDVGANEVETVEGGGVSVSHNSNVPNSANEMKQSR